MEKQGLRPGPQVLGREPSKGQVTADTSMDIETDINRWRLTVSEGRHLWHYLSAEKAAQKPLSFAEKWHLGIASVRLRQSRPYQVAF